jgi:hypothetical protein
VDFCTYLGGSDYDTGTSIDVNFGNGDIFVTGLTRSSDFPTQNAWQPVYGGSSDAFVTKLSPRGDQLLFSTYLGGSGFEIANGIASNLGAVFVTGATSSPDFPTKNSSQPANGGGRDAFVTKLDLSGSSLLYSTYLGGDGEDVANGIALDLSGNAYITGNTGSINLPTARPLQPGFGGVVDAFAAKLNTSILEEVSLAYCTYLGGGGSDFGEDIAIDFNGNAYICGSTNSVNFPLANAVQPKFGGASDAFVAKLNATGSPLVFSTYLGGNNIDSAYGIAIDIARNVYVAGETSSPDFPLVKPLQPSLLGGVDGFVTKLSPSGDDLRYSTYLGGLGEDRVFAVSSTAAGDAWVTGETLSSSFPTSSAGVQPAFGGASDALVASLHVPVPRINQIQVKGRKLIIEGEFFELGAVISIDSVPQKTRNDEDNPTTRLIAKKGGNRITPGQPTGIQVENPDGTRSEQTSFVRP